ncbi:hypothetical protein PIB30_071206 [Stylosanthes scabra]|uniref:Uncharacterized protein n=1 Tax=Stylosanthes scabra TaxID=79078 RepID=A0ABU6TNG7_9FABA|nr:hypothetical protein [Stylosanthes scabra]
MVLLKDYIGYSPCSEMKKQDRKGETELPLTPHLTTALNSQRMTFATNDILLCLVLAIAARGV